MTYDDTLYAPRREAEVAWHGGLVSAPDRINTGVITVIDGAYIPVTNRGICMGGCSDQQMVTRFVSISSLSYSRADISSLNSTEQSLNSSQSHAIGHNVKTFCRMDRSRSNGTGYGPGMSMSLSPSPVPRPPFSKVISTQYTLLSLLMIPRACYPKASK